MTMATLQNVLETFNAPLNEEQAWAVCHQCARYLENDWNKNAPNCFKFNGIPSVLIGKDGVVQAKAFAAGGSPATVDSEYELVQSLGMVVFQALDYGLSDTEEQKLSPPLEQLITRMTGSDLEDEAVADDKDDDEGIEEDNVASTYNKCTLTEVIQICEAHLPPGQEASSHYKAVCRALVNEAEELVTFLETISVERNKLREVARVGDEGLEVDDLQRSDWARLWIQIMRQLRHGVQLKKVEHIGSHSLEYELTPYEILMEDIRSRRYRLNKVMVNGDIPQKTKKDAHDIILEFIRSRPPLHPVMERKLGSPPVKSADAREELMEAIRCEHKLRPTPGRIVETSRTCLDEGDVPAPARKVIKPDLSLLMSNSFDDEEEEISESEEELEDRNRVLASPLSPLTPLETPTNPPPGMTGEQWQQKVVQNITKKAAVALVTRHDRRHSITVCESPSQPLPPSESDPAKAAGAAASYLSFNPSSFMSMALDAVSSFMESGETSTNPRNLHTSLECLSLTIEEVMHIRSVLTKAELECLVIDPQLQALIAKGKVCFTCKRTKFSLFGAWATRCKFCRRNVCSKCSSKMRIPTEHFEHIPVYTLSPSPMSPNSKSQIFAYEKTGSVPSSPDQPRKGPFNRSPPDLINNNKDTEKSRPTLQRAETIFASTFNEKSLQGPLMNICRDCKAMIVNIIRASRLSLAKAPEVAKEPIPDIPSRRPSRNFHLDLKPVYKQKPKQSIF